MKHYRVKGGLKKGTTIVLTACFLLGGSITSLAAGDGVTDGYKELAATTSVREADVDYMELDTDDEFLQEFAREYDLDPAHVTIMDDGIETYGVIKEIEWKVPAGETYMSRGFNLEIGDIATVVVKATPDTVQYETGIKDPDDIMRYVQGKGRINHDFYIDKKGRHYFYVTNMGSETLHIEATIVK